MINYFNLSSALYLLGADLLQDALEVDALRALDGQT
jgi:hypothetical protein